MFHECNNVNLPILDDKRFLPKDYLKIQPDNRPVSCSFRRCLIIINSLATNTCWYHAELTEKNLIKRFPHNTRSS